MPPIIPKKFRLIFQLYLIDTVQFLTLKYVKLRLKFVQLNTNRITDEEESICQRQIFVLLRIMDKHQLKLKETTD